MKNNKCILCKSKDYSTIHKGVRGNTNIDVLKCSVCGLVRLSDFDSNTDEYYRSSGMRKDDIETSICEIRNLANKDDKRRIDFIKENIENKIYLDFGCGAGGVLQYARDIAKESYGIEIETRMVKTLNGEGIKCYDSLDCAKDDLFGSIDVISLFHVLEHLGNPIYYLQELKTLLSDKGIMIIEVPNADDALLSLYECEAFADFTYWESHIYLYNNTTFTQLIEKSGLKIRFLGQIQRYPLSNTMYWLSKGKPRGHKEWSMLSDETVDRAYENQLAKLGIADTIIAIVEV